MAASQDSYALSFRFSEKDASEYQLQESNSEREACLQLHLVGLALCGSFCEK